MTPRIALVHLAAGITGLCLSCSAIAELPKSSMQHGTLQLAYLAGSTLRLASVNPGSARATVAVAWQLPRGEGTEDYAGLACGPDGRLAAHRVSVVRSPQPRQTAQVVFLDAARRTVKPIEPDRAITLMWPVWSPDGKSIAATTVEDGRDSVATVSLATGTVRVYNSDRRLSPRAWPPGESRILATGTDPSGNSWTTVSIDLVSGASSTVTSGGRAISSGHPPKLAVLERELGDIAVLEDGALKAKTSKGAFRDLVAWIDDSTVLAIESRGPRDRLALVDIRLDRVRPIEIEANERINSACVISSP